MFFLLRDGSDAVSRLQSPCQNSGRSASDDLESRITENLLRKWHFLFNGNLPLDWHLPCRIDHLDLCKAPELVVDVWLLATAVPEKCPNNHYPSQLRHRPKVPVAAGPESWGFPTVLERSDPRSGTGSRLLVANSTHKNTSCWPFRTRFCSFISIFFAVRG